MIKELLKEKRKVTAAKAVRILAQDGAKISEKEAENILEIMYFLAKLIVDQNFKT